MSIDKLTRAKCDAPARANLGPKMEDKDGRHWAQELCVCLSKSMEVGSVTIGHFSVPSLIDAWRKLMEEGIVAEWERIVAGCRPSGTQDMRGSDPAGSQRVVRVWGMKKCTTLRNRVTAANKLYRGYGGEKFTLGSSTHCRVVMGKVGKSP